MACPEEASYVATAGACSLSLRFVRLWLLTLLHSPVDTLLSFASSKA